MSSVDGSERSRAVLLYLVFALISQFLLEGCSLVGTSEREADPFLRVAHFSGGDAPLVTILFVWDNRASLKVLGSREVVRRVPKDETRRIRQLLQNPGLDDLKTSRIRSSHDEEVWLEFNGKEVGFSRANLPDETWELLDAVEDVFRERFRRYSLSLLPPSAV